MLPREFVTYQDRLYWIYRKVKQSQIKQECVSDVKEFWLCDIVVRSRTNDSDLLLFLREVEEAKVVKEII